MTMRNLSAWLRVLSLALLAGPHLGQTTKPATGVPPRIPGPMTARASLAAGEVQGNSPSADHSSIAAHGRFVAFMSSASNLALGDTNGHWDVFARDLQLGTTERVSVDSSGVEGNLDSLFPSISADGRYVAFWSEASNLVPADTNGVSDIFVRDLQLETTERVSVDPSGANGNSFVDYAPPSISAQGRFVAFGSHATNLVAADTNGYFDVFVRDRLSGTTERVSVDSAGVQGNFHSQFSALSADGRYVAFWSVATNLVPADTNGRIDVFVHDRSSGSTERVSVGSAGQQGNGSSGNFEPPSISADGRLVAFTSSASNLVPGDTNASDDVFVHDRSSGITERVSVDSAGAEGNSLSRYPSLSANGRYVAFMSSASNLVPRDTNGHSDIFVRDRVARTTTRVSVTSIGRQANLDSFYPSFSADGRYVAFWSKADNLVSADTNGWDDVFVHAYRAP